MNKSSDAITADSYAYNLPISFLNAIPDALLVKNESLEIIFCNDLAAQLFNKKRSQLIGKTDSQLYPFDFAGSLEQQSHQVFLTAATSETLETLRNFSQTHQYWKFKKSLVQSPEASPYLLEIIQPIVAPEGRQLTYSLSLLKAALESTADGIMIADGAGKILQFNQKFAKMWQLPVNLLAEKNDEAALEFVLTQLKEPEKFLDKIRSLYDDPNAVSFDILKFKDGRIFERYSQPQKVENQTIGRVWSFRDVTEKIKAEERLRANISFLQTLIETIPNPVFYKDRTGKYLGCNNAFSEFLNMEKSKIVGCSVRELTASKHAQKFEDVDKFLFEKGGDDIIELQVERVAGNRQHIMIHKKAFFNAEGEVGGLVGSILDITEIKKAQCELIEKNTELQRYIDSNLELENFAYFASHDLREPLRTIGNFTQLLQRKYHNQFDQSGHEYMDFIINSAQRMNQLIEDLLTFSRVNSNGQAFEQINLPNLLTIITHSLHQTMKENQAVIHFDKIPTYIFAGKTQISQLFQNLLANAIKFRKPGVTPEIHVEGFEKPTYWQFSIADNGIGIKPEFHDRIFLLFRKLHLKEEYEGTGIGLALCKKIIDQHSGRIWIESEEGVGTTFHFTIAK